MAISRELRIRYGGFVVGDGTEYHIEGYHNVERRFDVSSVDFDFVVRSDDPDTFAAACRAAESAFRTPYQQLTVTIRGKVLIALGGASGFDAAPNITKPDHILQTGRSRLYRVSIEYGMEANTGAERSQGLRSLEVDVTYSPSRRRTIALSGEWTSVSGNTAQEQYEAKIKSFASSVLTDFGGVYEVIDEKITQDTNNNVVEFNRVYAEIIYEQGKKGTLNDPDIVDQHFMVTVRRSGPGDSPYGQAAPVRLRIADVSYSCSVDKERTQALDQKYNTIRKWLVDKVRSITKGKSVALVEEAPQFDLDDNRIEATMVMHVTTGSMVIEYEEASVDDLNSGETLVPIWSGDPLSKYRYQGPATLRRTVDAKVVWDGTLSERAASFEAQQLARATLSSRPSASPVTSDSGLISVFMTRNVRISHKTRGLDAFTFPVTEGTFTVMWEFHKKASAGGTVTPPPVLTPSG